MGCESQRLVMKVLKKTCFCTDVTCETCKNSLGVEVTGSAAGSWKMEGSEFYPCRHFLPAVTANVPSCAAECMYLF